MKTLLVCSILLLVFTEAMAVSTASSDSISDSERDDYRTLSKHPRISAASKDCTHVCEFLSNNGVATDSSGELVFLSDHEDSSGDPLFLDSDGGDSRGDPVFLSDDKSCCSDPNLLSASGSLLNTESVTPAVPVMVDEVSQILVNQCCSRECLLNLSARDVLPVKKKLKSLGQNDK